MIRPQFADGRALRSGQLGGPNFSGNFTEGPKRSFLDGTPIVVQQSAVLAIVDAANPFDGLKYATGSWWCQAGSVGEIPLGHVAQIIGSPTSPGMLGLQPPDEVPGEKIGLVTSRRMPMIGWFGLVRLADVRHLCWAAPNPFQYPS